MPSTNNTINCHPCHLNHLPSDLQQAICFNQTDAIRRMCSCTCKKAKSLSNVVMINKSTPLGFAISKDNAAAVRALLDAGANPRKYSEDSVGRVEPALVQAVRRGNREIVKVLLDSDQVNPNQKDLFQLTPIFLAVKDRRFDLMQLLLDDYRFKLNYQQDKKLLEFICENVEFSRFKFATELINCGFPIDESTMNIIFMDKNIFELAPIVCLARNKKFPSRFTIANEVTKNLFPLSLQTQCRAVIRRQIIAKTKQPIREPHLTEYFKNEKHFNRNIFKKIIHYLANLQYPKFFNQADVSQLISGLSNKCLCGCDPEDESPDDPRRNSARRFCMEFCCKYLSKPNYWRSFSSCAYNNRFIKL